MEDLDRHHPVHLRLFRLVDGTHPARSDPLQDPELAVQDLATNERVVRAGLNHGLRQIPDVSFCREGTPGGIMAEKSMDFAEVLTSPLLTRCGFRHAFFARGGGVSTGAYSSLNFSIAVGDTETNVTENVARAAAALGVSAERVYYLSQVHGRVAVSLRGDESRSEVVMREGDALSSRNGHCAVGVRIADCVPILLGNTETGAVAAVHAGWRGIVAGVVEAGVDAIRGAASSATSLIAAIGPHISVTAFEVSEEVAGTLQACSPDPDVVDRSHGPKPHVDLARIATAKLEALGVPRASVDRVGGCTFLEPERYFSFRRDGPRSGRHLAAIVAR